MLSLVLLHCHRDSLVDPSNVEGVLQLALEIFSEGGLRKLSEGESQI